MVPLPRVGEELPVGHVGNDDVQAGADPCPVEQVVEGSLPDFHRQMWAGSLLPAAGQEVTASCAAPHSLDDEAALQQRSCGPGPVGLFPAVPGINVLVGGVVDGQQL